MDYTSQTTSFSCFGSPSSLWSPVSPDAPSSSVVVRAPVPFYPSLLPDDPSTRSIVDTFDVPAIEKFLGDMWQEPDVDGMVVDVTPRLGEPVLKPSTAAAVVLPVKSAFPDEDLPSPRGEVVFAFFAAPEQGDVVSNDVGGGCGSDDDDEESSAGDEDDADYRPDDDSSDHAPARASNTHKRVRSTPKSNSKRVATSRQRPGTPAPELPVPVFAPMDGEYATLPLVRTWEGKNTARQPLQMFKKIEAIVEQFRDTPAPKRCPRAWALVLLEHERRRLLLDAYNSAASTSGATGAAMASFCVRAMESIKLRDMKSPFMTLLRTPRKTK